jgi:hypothetical protein
MDATGPAEVEQIIEQLEKSVREGRVDLHFQHGPDVRDALTTITRAPADLPAPAHSAEVS